MYSRRLFATTRRTACSTIPRWHSSYRTSAGNIGKPAASPDVQPDGLSAFEVRSNLAPLEACQPLWVSFICQVSQMEPTPAATMMPWRSPPVLFTSICHCCKVRPGWSLGQVSIGMLDGIGYDPL